MAMCESIAISFSIKNGQQRIISRRIPIQNRNIRNIQHISYLHSKFLFIYRRGETKSVLDEICQGIATKKISCRILSIFVLWYLFFALDTEKTDYPLCPQIDKKKSLSKKVWKMPKILLTLNFQIHIIWLKGNKSFQ